MIKYQKIVLLMLACGLLLSMFWLFKHKEKSYNTVLDSLSHPIYILKEKEVAAEWKSTEVGAVLQAFLAGSELEEGVEAGEAYEELTNTSILPPSARIVAKKIFHVKPLLIWATEWHMTPVKDIANVLKPFGVVVKDYNLDPWRCAWHDCNAKKDLKVLTPQNVLDLVPEIEEKYIKTYEKDAEMKAVDVVYCGYPASLCQVYVKLNKSVLIQASTRYDVGRYTPERLNKLNEDYRQLARQPWNVIAGNNLYDAQFITYYSGVKTFHLPSICDYTGAEYTNTDPHFILFRRRDNGFMKNFYEDFETACLALNCSVKTTELAHYEYASAAARRGVVHIPYQVSVMSIFEQYRMNIPMFVPSPRLLATWQLKHFLMPERSFEGAFMHKKMNKSVVPAHPSQKHVPDPKDDFDFEDILFWVNYADFYQALPHCVIYDSVPHLVHILQTISDQQLQQISAKMRAFNVDFKKKMLRKWRAILLTYAKNSPNHPH